MSDTPPAADAAKSSDGKKIGPIAIVIIVFVLVFFGIIPQLTNQIGHLFQMLKMNAGPVLFILAALGLFGVFRKK